MRRRTSGLAGWMLLASAYPATADAQAADPAPATAQDAPASATAQDAPAPAARTEPPAAPTWIATLSTGVLVLDGDTGQPFVIAGVSRKVGRGYVRVAATGFRSVVRQIDAVLPSKFVVGSVGAGGTFGRWFVDGYASAGRQDYGGVTTPLGTRDSQVGDGSAVYGAALSGGRFVSLSRRLYLTPSAAIQHSTNRTLRSALGPAGPQDYETRERAWTGSATLRLDRYFGGASQHIAGVSVSRVQTSNGAVVLAGNSLSGPAATTSVADGWFVAGASGSLRVAPRLWLDGSATRTLGARSGNYNVVALGLRVGF